MRLNNIKNKIDNFQKSHTDVLNSAIDKATKAKIILTRTKKTTVLTCIVFALLIMLPCVPFTNITLAYEVKCDGETIGYVANEEIVNEAEEIAGDQIEGNIKEVATSTEYNIAIVSNNDLDDADKLSEKIIDNSSMVKDAYGIYIKENCIAISNSKTTLSKRLNLYKQQFEDKEKADYSDFVEPVEIKDCKSVDTELNTQEEIDEAIKNSINVKTGVYTKKTVQIKYNTKYEKDDSLYTNNTKVKQKGENGKKTIQYITYYLDGKKQNTKKVSEKITKKAVTQIILKGTKETPEVRKNDGAKYAWPVEYKSSEYISSGFGTRNGRLHKGIDICTDYGTTITSVMDGTVVRASVFESYGYCVDIKNSDGNLTRYAHCSELLVSVGDKVVMGDAIAKVGSTGRSTGNHLHFEVRVGGTTLVNPLVYLKGK